MITKLPSDMMGCVDSEEAANWWLWGVPFDGTTSNRPGTRFGPLACRDASWGLENYSPSADRHIDDAKVFDQGDIELCIGDTPKVMEQIAEMAHHTLKAGKKPIVLGGEHSITWPIFREVFHHYGDVALLQFDAHTDLRSDYLGNPFSHASVMYRCQEILKNKNMFRQVGIRSGMKSEWDWMREHKTLLNSPDQLKEWLQSLGNKPLYLTIDLDVMDPSLFPGTGTPEPGGFGFRDLFEYLKLLRGKNLVAIDLVELSPHYDQTGVSSAAAAKVFRDLMATIA